MSKVKNLHPKVAAAGVGGALSTAILALLAAVGLHLSPAESDAIVAVSALVGGYLKAT